MVCCSHFHELHSELILEKRTWLREFTDSRLLFGLNWVRCQIWQWSPMSMEVLAKWRATILQIALVVLLAVP